MKIILSRKGFDSRAGGYASPIMPDGELLSLPIPVMGEGERGIAYGDLYFGDQPLDQIICQLTNGALRDREAHLDPDLDRERFPRRDPNWRPAFGQGGSAQGHLRNQDVGEGDLFLFYGWFRQTENEETPLQYVRPFRDMHVIFGWLQVGRTVTVGRDDIPNWLGDHPHVVNAHQAEYGINNTIYIASGQLALNEHRMEQDGAGAFSHFNERLRLTAPDEIRRSYWRLPSWLCPFGDPHRPPLTYHGNMNRWTLEDGHVMLRSASPGQEFVFDTEDYPEAMQWLEGLFEGGVGNG